MTKHMAAAFLVVSIATGYLVTITIATDVNFTYVSAVDGRVTLTYDENPASTCMLDRRMRSLTCLGKHAYNETADIWINTPETVKYIKMNCGIEGAYEQNQCYCMNTSPSPVVPCHFTYLDSGMLSNLTSLEVLDLSYNRIERVNMFAFVNLTNIRYISLSNNNIIKLDPGLFCATPALEYLALNNLKFEQFTIDSFHCKTKFNLKVLEIINSNVTDVPRNFLDQLTSLDTFDLRFNPLTILYKQSFSGTQSLVKLNLSDCKLKTLFPHFCDYFPNLEHLHLSGNDVTSFSLDDIRNCTALKVLNVSRNSMHEFSGNAFGLNSLKIIDISDNSLQNLNTTFSILPALDEIYIQDNKLPSLATGQFTGAKKITRISLRNNSIAETGNFIDVFSDVKQLLHLDLGFNNIQTFPDNAFQNLTNLLRLMLDHNQISKIDQQVFSGLMSLKDLYLENNHIHNITNQPFSYLTNLEDLDISSNAMTSVFESAFSGLSKLKYLKLDQNRIGKLPNGLLDALTSLQRLELSFNKLTQLGTQKWPSLSYLDLCHNKLKRIPSSVRFDVMQHLNISHNNVEAFFGTNENLLANFGSMLTADLSFNNISDISPNVFKSFEQLISLNMANNSISLALSSELFNNTQHLKYLNLANNRFNLAGSLFKSHTLINLEVLNISGNDLFEVKPLTQPSSVDVFQLKTIDISNCNLQSLYTNTFQGLTNLKTVNLRDNAMQTFPPMIAGPSTVFDLTKNPIVCACNMTWLAEQTVDIGQGVKVDVGNFHIPKCSVYTEQATYFPRELRRYQFKCRETNQTVCDSKCECFTYEAQGDVAVVECQNNLNVIPNVIPKSATSVFLDGNSFTSTRAMIEMLRFTDMQTKQLYLNNSAIGHLHADMFSGFKNLEILSLANNVITELPEGLFNFMKSLQELHLQGNAIVTIRPGVLVMLPILRELDISGNNMTVLSAGTVNDLVGLKAIKYYWFARNPWLCNCDNMHFRDFVHAVQFKIRDRRTLGCDKGSEILYVDRFKFGCNISDDNPSGKGRSAIIVGAIIGAAMALILFAALYYFRRELLSMLYYKTGCHVPGKGRIPGKHFDVFINYDPTDQNCSEYIQSTLLPRLKNNQYSLQTSVDVIQDLEVTKKLLEDSRCSLFVIDKNFASNNFMMNVYLAATKLQKATKKHKVILIVHGDIDLFSLEPEVMSRMRKGDYITSRSRLWWERLVYELPDPCSGFRPRAGSDNDEDVVVFSSLAEDQYEQI